VGDVNGDGAVDFIFGEWKSIYLVYGVPNPSPSLPTSTSVSQSPSQQAARTPPKPTRRSQKPSRPRVSPTPRIKDSSEVTLTSWSPCLLVLTVLMTTALVKYISGCCAPFVDARIRCLLSKMKTHHNRIIVVAHSSKCLLIVRSIRS